MRSSFGWEFIDAQRKTAIIDSICGGPPPAGPSHVELNLTDRCNAACFFCNQELVRTGREIPFERVRSLIDELCKGGLKSVRLSGGGDPLHHRRIHDVLDHLRKRCIVVDNVTTNGIALDEAISRCLVAGKAREVVVSLKAGDQDDYHRMMRIKSAHFDAVLEHIGILTKLKGDAPWPAIIVQFLLDQENFSSLPEMYRLAIQAGANGVEVNPVLPNPNSPVDLNRLLGPEHATAVRPFLVQTLEADRSRRCFNAGFPIDGWHEMVVAAHQEANTPGETGLPTASTFCEQSNYCFFSSYTAVINGSGEVHPCCLLLGRDTQPLDNVLTDSFRQIWTCARFGDYRREQRSVFLTGNKTVFWPGKFGVLARACVVPGLCFLKNAHYRSDEWFCRQLNEALQVERRREIKWIGAPRKVIRRIEMTASSSDRMGRAFQVLTSMSRSIRRLFHS